MRDRGHSCFGLLSARVTALGLLLLFMFPARASEPSKEITIRISWAGPSAGDVVLVAQPTSRPAPTSGLANSTASGFGEDMVMARCPSFDVRVLGADGRYSLGPNITVPSDSSEFVLFLQGDSPLVTRAMLIPSDLASFGWGTSMFVNLSVNRLRCTLGGSMVELAPGEVRACALALKQRKVLVMRVECQEGGRWVLNSSTPVILTEHVRAIFGFGPGNAHDGVLRGCSIYETDPATTLPRPTAEPTVMPVATPLPDLPAK